MSKHDTIIAARDEQFGADAPEAWQHLVTTGLAWRLPRWFGDMAAALLQAGVIHHA